MRFFPLHLRIYYVSSVLQPLNIDLYLLKIFLIQYEKASCMCARNASRKVNLSSTGNTLRGIEQFFWQRNLSLLWRTILHRVARIIIITSNKT